MPPPRPDAAGPLSAAGPRFVALDGLRGLAALLVVLYHAAWPNHLTGAALVRQGFLAVDLFFVLSGFIIASAYAERLAAPGAAGAFVITRFFRVYPLHAAALLALVGLELLRVAAAGLGLVAPGAAFTGPNEPSRLAASALLLHGLGLFGPLGWNFPSWSISAEFAAYIAFLGLARAGGLAARLWPFAALALGGAAYLLVALGSNGLDVTDGRGLARCLAGFAIGAAVWRLSGGNRRAVLPSGSATLLEAILALLLLAALVLARGAAEVVVVPLLAAMVWVFRHDAGAVSRWLAGGPTQWLARHSYAIYIVHIPALIVFWLVGLRLAAVPLAPGPGGVPFPSPSPLAGDLALGLYLLLVLATAALAHRLIEEPGRRLGRRIASRRLARGRAVDVHDAP